MNTYNRNNQEGKRRRRRPFRQMGSITTAAAAAAVTTVAFSLSIVAAFQPCRPRLGSVTTTAPARRMKNLQTIPMPYQPLKQSTRLHVLKDPDSLLQETLPYSDWRNDNIEKLYTMSKDDQFIPHSELNRGGTAKSSHPLQFKGLTSTARKRKARNPIKTNKALKKTTTTTTAKKKTSSTMPGFGAESSKQRAYRDGIRLAERRSGRKHVETNEAKNKRRKINGEAMYVSSASVPDSMVHFATEIHQEDRITRQEEIELGEKTQEAVRLQNHFEALRMTLDREPTDEEWCAAAGKINMEALRLAIEEGLEAKNKLVTSNLRMVQSVVNTYIRNGLSGQYNAGDLMQEGILALIRAAEKFEPDRGWKFSTYAMYWVRSSVKRNQIYQSRRITVPQRLHESYKRLLKIEADLKVELKRQPTRKELGEVIGMSELQVDRCIAAMEQRCFSLDQEISNIKKPMAASSGSGDTLLDILDNNVDDGEHGKIEQVYLRDDLIETLHRHLTPHEVELLLFRYGFKEIPGRNINSQITIAELSRIFGLTPDKVRRTIKKSLDQLKEAGSEEWLSFQRQLP